MTEPEGNYDLVIVGAGAAGLWAAGSASRRARARRAELAIALVDGREQVGAKILMSGGTRCNLTHESVRAEDFRGGNRNRIRRILRAHPPAASLERFTRELGVPVKIEPELGKVFPEDDRAATVLAALLSDLERQGVPLLTRRRCVALAPAGDGDARQRRAPETRWRLTCGDEELVTRRVILATGGRSYPKTGSDGAVWELLAALGHTIVTPVPALSPFVLGAGFHRALTGVSCGVHLRLLADGRLDADASGAMLFTHFGVSGPAALDLSGHWARAQADRPGVARAVHASFLPDETSETLRARWLETVRARPKVPLRRLVETLPRRLVDALLGSAEADPAAPIGQIDRETRRRVIGTLLEFPLPVAGVRGFAQAEVTSGGVPLEEVDHGLESRRLPGIHFAGEVLHVDGRLGGFNFQWAWSSATVAAEAAIDRLLLSPGA